MARPKKQGIEYFPLDIGLENDDKLVVVVSKHGTLGFGIVVRLMAEVYRNGYFYAWGEREQHTFSSKINVDINTVLSVVSECIKWGFFHQKLYEEHGILTSSGFQKRYLTATYRRADNTILPEYLLIVSDDKNMVSDDNNEVFDSNVIAESTQSKVNKSKVNKSKVKEPKKTSSRQPKTYAEDTLYFKMASYLNQLIMNYAESLSVGHLVRNANLQTWADDCRKIIELDKRDKDEVRKVMMWAANHTFWQKQILSASTLRAKYERLCIEMAADDKKNTNSQVIPLDGSTAGRRHGKSGKPQIPVVERKNDPAERLSDEEMTAAREMAKRLDEKFNAVSG